ncbi:hypothetical protein OY671_012708, partial [Metschnikowia pulcherrima]
WAAAHDPASRASIEARARDWFSDDRDCQAWEPGGDEFLSPASAEASSMSRVLDRDAFAVWFAALSPRAEQGQPGTSFTPASVSDRSDGKIAHSDGLNLSRAWCWRAIGAASAPHPSEPSIARTIEDHSAASSPHVAGDYMGEHWSAT